MSNVSIFIRTITANLIEIKIPLSATVNDLKKQIETKTGIPPAQQKLVFSGRRIDDDKVLSDVGLCVIMGFY